MKLIAQLFGIVCTHLDRVPTRQCLGEGETKRRNRCMKKGRQREREKNKLVLYRINGISNASSLNSQSDVVVVSLKVIQLFKKLEICE